jgi:hypothetical protein
MPILFPKQFRWLLIVLALLMMVPIATPTAGCAQVIDRPTSSSELLQFTSGGHILGFESQGMYVATGSQALWLQFLDTAGVPPQSADLSGLQKATLLLSRVTYPNLWPGVTLTYDAPPGGIVRSTYRLEPYADVSAIRLRYNTPPQLQAGGSLRLEFETGAMLETAPLAWQELGGRRAPVEVAFKFRSKMVHHYPFVLTYHIPLTATTNGSTTFVLSSFLAANDTLVAIKTVTVLPTPRIIVLRCTPRRLVREVLSLPPFWLSHHLSPPFTCP